MKNTPFCIKLLSLILYHKGRIYRMVEKMMKVKMK
nr:MAG TPA: hypothetical protein [Caudoviricetes sp.]